MSSKEMLDNSNESETPSSESAPRSSHCSHANHTLGPWRIYHWAKYHELHGYPSSIGQDDDLGLDASDICRIDCADVEQDTAWANAKLIAAAPELLAACRDMIEAMNDYECTVDDPPTPKHREMMLRAMKAVEKATHQVV